MLQWKCTLRRELFTRLFSTKRQRDKSNQPQTQTEVSSCACSDLCCRMRDRKKPSKSVRQNHKQPETRFEQDLAVNKDDTEGFFVCEIWEGFHSRRRVQRYMLSPDAFVVRRTTAGRHESSLSSVLGLRESWFWSAQFILAIKPKKKKKKPTVLTRNLGSRYSKIWYFLTPKNKNKPNIYI